MSPISLRRISSRTGAANLKRHGASVCHAENETDSDGFKADDFYPIGVSARVENISDEDVIQIRTLDRVEILDPVIEDGDVRASFVVRPCMEDMPEEEQQNVFAALRADLLRFVQGYQWGLWARGTFSSGRMSTTWLHPCLNI